MKKNFRLLLLVFSSLIIGSCKKNDKDAAPAVSCMLAKAHYFDGTSSSPADSLIYTYTNDRITKMTNSRGYTTLEYANERVIKRIFFDSTSTEPEAYDMVTYNSDGSLNSIKTFLPGTGLPLLFAHYDFIYNNAKLSKLDVQQYDLNSGKLELIISSTFTHSGYNITQSVNTYYDPVGVVYVLTLDYSYDSNANFFAKSNAIFTDYIFADGIDGSIIPLLLSNNNVTKAVGVNETLIKYTVDNKNNFFEFYFEGQLTSRYSYDCK